MSDLPDPVSPRDKLLDAAERLFTEHGFAAVKLKHLAQASGLHHATFYHHAPGGKIQLFQEAMERSLARHETALVARVAQHEGDLRAQLHAVAEWVLSNPAGNHTHMLSTDLPNLPPEVAERLAARSYRGLIGPVAGALRSAWRGNWRERDPQLAPMVAGGILAALQALQAAHARYAGDTSALDEADRLIDVLLEGLRSSAP